VIDFEVEIKGARELHDAILRLGDAKAIKRALKKTIRAGASVLRREIRKRAPKKTGTLRKSIKVKPWSRTRNTLGFSVGPDMRVAPHAPLVEYGTGPRKQKSTGRSTGQMPARPFMRPAYEAIKDEVVKAILDRGWKAVEEETRKLSVGAGK